MVVFSFALSRIPNLILGIGLSFLLGIIVGPVMIAVNTVVHQVSDESMRGKVFSSLEFVMHFAFLVSMLASSVLAEHFERFGFWRR